MTEGKHSSRHTRGALWLAALIVSVSGHAQNSGFSPSEANRMMMRAQLCGDEHESSDDRIRACTEIIKDGGLRGRDLANMHINRARAARSAHEDEDAAHDLDLAIKADDRYAVPFFERGNFRADHGDIRQALEDYDRAIRLKGTYPEFFINRGNTHKDLGDRAAAVADYGKAIELDPKSAVGHSNRGGLYLAEEKLDAAIQDFDKASTLAKTAAR